MNNFEKIINFNKKYQYKQFNQTNPNSKTYLVTENNNKQIILKENNNKSFEEYKLIIKTITILNQNKFPTTKLLYSKYDHKTNTSIFIFEYFSAVKELIHNFFD